MTVWGVLIVRFSYGIMHEGDRKCVLDVTTNLWLKQTLRMNLLGAFSHENHK